MTVTRRRAVGLAASAALIAAYKPSPARAGDQLRIGGTGSAMELIAILARAFRQRAPDTEFVVVPGLGSGGSIRAVRDGALDLAISARPLDAEEATTLAGHAFALSPFVFATSHASPGPLTRPEIAAKYVDPKAQWPDGSPLSIILRPRAESDTRLIAALFPEVARAIETARRRADVPVAVTDIDNAAMAERTRGSLATISLAQMRVERRSLRAITIDGAVPSLANLRSGAYPYGRPLHLVHAREPGAALGPLLAFLRSPEAGHLLQAWDAMPLQPA